MNVASIIREWRRGKKEKFVARTPLEKLADQGFKPLVKDDTLQRRIEDFKDILFEATKALNMAKTDEEKGEAVVSDVDCLNIRTTE